MRVLLCKLIIFLISLIDKTEKSNYDLDETGKLVKSFPVRGIKVMTDSGWREAGFIHQTIPFEIWKVTTENHTLECADLHKVFRPNYEEVFVDELVVGDEILTENGPEKVLSIIKSGQEVSMVDLTIMDGDARYYTNGILSHNTTTSAIFMLWYILFNVDKNALVLGNKRKTAVEILDKAKNIFYAIPFFLKPGVYKWNEGEIVLDNGCRLMCEATTVNSGISFTFHCVLADEFAHIEKNIMEPFYNNLFPTITAGKARFMITSTQNGYNLFYRLYTAAAAGENDYAPFVTDWWEVPEWNPDTLQWEQRTEQWHQRQVANYGGEEEFNKQFGTDFCGSSVTLVNAKLIKECMKDAYRFKRGDLLGVSHPDCWYWREGFDIGSLKRNYFLITGDLAEGIGSDSTVFHVIQVKVINGEFYYEVAGFFKSNKLGLHIVQEEIATFCSLYMKTDQYFISIEWNTYGELFFNFVREYDEKHNDPNYGVNTYVQYESTRQGEFIRGYRLNGANKAICCNQFKRLFESRHYILPDLTFLNELQCFGDINGNGRYAAISGHDDMVMSAIGITYIHQSILWKNLMEEILMNKGVPPESSNQFYDMYSF